MLRHQPSTIMKKNIGSFDAGARFVLGCVVLFLGVQSIGWWGLTGFLLWLTGAISFCPLYAVLRINTARWEENWERRHPHPPPDLHHLN